MFLLSLALVIVLPCILIAALVQLESYHTVRLSVLILALTWGIISFFLARQVELFINLNDYRIVTIVIAPIVEEGFKSVAIIVMYVFVLVRYPGDALIYGFAVGAGFGMMENLMYVLLEPLFELQQTGTVSELSIFGVALTRIASTGLIHAAIGATVATFVSSAVYYKPLHALRVALGLVLVAILVHSAYNLVLWLENDSLITITGLTLGMLSLLVLLWLLNFNARSEAYQIMDELQYDPAHLLTRQIETPDGITTPLDYMQQNFDKRQRKLIERYLMKQGRLAVYAEQLDDGDQRPAAIRALKRAISVERMRAARIYDQMMPDVQTWLKQTNLVDVIPQSRDIR